MTPPHASIFRPVPARWFELLTAREELPLVVEALATTRTVELETHSEVTTRPRLPEIESRLEEYHRLAARFGRFWPPRGRRPTSLPGNPAAALGEAVDRLHGWRDEAQPLVEEMERLDAEREELLLLRLFVDSLGDTRLRLELLGTRPLATVARLFLLPAGTRIAALPAGVITLGASAPGHDFLLAVGEASEVEALRNELAGLKARPLPLPEWLAQGGREPLPRIDERVGEIGRRRAELENDLHRLNHRHRLGEALGEIARIEWFLANAETIPASEEFAWVTGWTIDPTGEGLNRATEAAGAHALLRFPEAPAGKHPPLVLSNPPWARPFELFARLLGTPGSNEADPSRLLGVVVPLMFGYMFGDVGQGALLLLAGLALRSRYPALGILIPAGGASMAFGWLFGSLFSLEGVIAPLWIHPLEDPIALLALPLWGGALLLLVGLLINGLEASWRGELRGWARQEAGMLPLYAGMLGLALDPHFGYLALAGLFWFLVGGLAGNTRRLPSTLLSHLGALLETTFQLLINTISFARVGAFALAHAGLSTAVTGLADLAGGAGAVIILILGNGVIILLEGLIVSIQITRLVLFEFFIRFLRGEGRAFRPLPPPPGEPGDEGDESDEKEHA